jgi:hypothetical protein
MIFRHQQFSCKVVICVEIFRFYQTDLLHSMFQRLSFKLSYNFDRRWPVFNMDATLMSVAQPSGSGSA